MTSKELSECLMLSKLHANSRNLTVSAFEGPHPCVDIINGRYLSKRPTDKSLREEINDRSSSEKIQHVASTGPGLS